MKHHIYAYRKCFVFSNVRTLPPHIISDTHILSVAFNILQLCLLTKLTPLEDPTSQDDFSYFSNFTEENMPHVFFKFGANKDRFTEVGFEPAIPRLIYQNSGN